MASHMSGDEDADSVHPKLKEFKQKQREVRCAVHLAEKLQVCLDNGEEEFTRRAVEEANELGQSAFGGTLLNVIGTTYVEQVCVCVCDAVYVCQRKKEREREGGREGGRGFVSVFVCISE
jgi:hypothetical protein